ncbi:MAG: hypothetical protein ACF8MF_12255 [Phycisphaerales bacterium JB052]
MIWSFLYWLLLSLAVLVGLRALFWDRAGFRGRAKLRCRKCWYDLTGAEGDLREGPIVCPECGKKHASRRAMRKTRRGKRWIALALVLWMGAYAIRVTPSVKMRGWVAAVPEPVLVLTIPFFDGTPGSSFDQTMWGYKPKQTIWDRLAREARGGAWNEPRSWVADRLVFLLARLDSPRVITDSTSDRGTLYASRIGLVIERGKAYGFEERWARSVVYAEFHTRDRVAPGTTIFGELKIRRLVQGVYRVDVGHNAAWFEARTRSGSVSLGGRGSGGGPGISSSGEYIKLEQWDTLKRMPRIAYGESTEGEMMVSRYRLDPAATGVQDRTVAVTVYDRFGDPHLGTVGWERVMSRDIAFAFIADPEAGPEVIEDAGLADIIDSFVDAELGLRFDPETSRWRLVASLTNDGLQETEGVTFGGEVSIEVQRREGQQVSYKRLLRGPKKWWRWVAPTRPPAGMDENSREYWELWSEGELVPSGSENEIWYSEDAWDVPFEDDGSNVGLENGDGRLVLVVRPDPSGSNRIVFADAKAQRVLVGELVFPIRDWTIEELNRYRVSGEIPEHAMP